MYYRKIIICRYLMLITNSTTVQLCWWLVIIYWLLQSRHGDKATQKSTVRPRGYLGGIAVIKQQAYKIISSYSCIICNVLEYLGTGAWDKCIYFAAYVGNNVFSLQRGKAKGRTQTAVETSVHERLSTKFSSIRIDIYIQISKFRY